MGSNNNSSMVLSIIMSSSAAMMKLLLISIVGIIAAKYPRNDPILPPISLKYISRLSNIVLLPCLIIKSLGGTINIYLLSRIGILTLFCFIINSVSFLICDTIGYWIHNGSVNGDRNSELFIAIKIAAGNGNAISLPILVMEILCQDPLINGDYNNDSDQCYAEASSMIFVYMIVWFIMFWGYSFPILQHLKQREVNAEQERLFLSPTNNNDEANNGDRDGSIDVSIDVATILQRHRQSDDGTNYYSVDGLMKLLTSQLYRIQSTVKNPETHQHIVNTAKKIIWNPAIISVIIALFIGLIPPIRNQFFSPTGSLAIVGTSMATIGEPVVALNTLIMAASLAQCDFPIEQYKRYFDTFLFKDTSDVDKMYDEIPPQVIVNGSESTDGVGRASLEMIEEQPYGSSSEVSNRNNSEAVSDVAIVTPPPPVAVDGQTLPPTRSILALIASRLILPPVVMLILNPIFMSIGFIDKSQRLMLLIIMLESCAPSAQVLIVALNQLGIASAASSMSYMYVFLYGASILTVTMWTTIAMSIYY